MKRPNLTISDARAIEEQAPTIQFVDIELGAGGPADAAARVLPRPEDAADDRLRHERELRRRHAHPVLGGRFFNGTEVQYRKNVVVLGNTPYQLLFEPSGTDPIGKMVRVGAERFAVVGVFDKRPRPAASTPARTTSS